MWVLAATLTCGLATVMTSCDDDEVDDVMKTLNIVGKWNTTSQISPTVDDLEIVFNSVIEFKADGSFISSDTNGEQSIGQWKLKDKTLTINFTEDGNTFTQNYSVQDGWTRDRMVLLYSFIDEETTYTITITITMNRAK